MEPTQNKKIDIFQIEQEIADSYRHVIVQTAPAVRVALGELFGGPIGDNVTGKMVTALKMIGFDGVFDTNFGADATVVEEATEFYERILNGGPFPQYSSCCIGWLQLSGRLYPEIVNGGYISSVKSPIGCFGALAKTYYAAKMNLDPRDIAVVSIVPCVLKKNEATLPYNTTNGMYDCDYTITTKDLAYMIQERNIDFYSLEDTPFDNPLGESTGGSSIFGRSGGVLEAIIRTLYYIDTGKNYEGNIEFTESPVSKDTKEFSLTIAGREIRVAHCSTGGAKAIVAMQEHGEKPYDFVEVMACPGGCIMGAGQPIHLPAEGLSPATVQEKRRSSLNVIDDDKKHSCSLENESLKKIYDEIFESKPGSEQAVKILHRRY